MTMSLQARLLASTIAIGAFGVAMPAAAQTAAPAVGQTPPTSDDPSSINAAPESGQIQDAPSDVVVTGTRITGPGLTSAAPVQSITSADIQATGQLNVQDVLLRNPTFGTPTFSRTNTAFATSGIGVATVDLRNLGIDRTLVLIDGRRVVSGVPGSAAVDLNMIPTEFIERVDVLTEGASAVYGSDAVAGVVNIIYRHNFQGIQANIQDNISERGDDHGYRASVTLGSNFDDNRGNIMVNFTYDRQGRVYARDRSTEVGSNYLDATSKAFITGSDFDLFTPYNRFSSYSLPGNYFTDNSVFTYNSTGDLVPGTSTFNRNEYRTLAVPTERYLLAVRGNYEINEHFNAFIEGTYASTRVSTSIEPFPFDTSYLTASGQIPLESLVNGVVVRNAYVPDAIYNDASDNDGDGLRDIFVTKRLGDFGPRTSRSTRENFRIVAGVNGQITDRFRYEAYYDYGQTNQAQIGSGQFNAPSFRQALNAVVDTTDLDGDGNTTEVVCADATARAQGCIPANIFGPGSLAPASAYLAAPQSLNERVTQQVAHVDVSGTLFSIFGADPIGVSVGAEYRRETSDSEFDALSQAGLNGGNKLPATSGRFDVYEFFGEGIVPILSDRPFFHALQVQGAVRYSHYSTAGTAYSYNYGGQWAPIADIRFRATRAQATRAPNISELFAPPQQDFPTGLIDPCAGITATGGGALGDNCRAAPGVLANIAANGAFTVSQADQQGITSFAGGNPNLSAEKSHSFTAGVVINPTSIHALRNLSLTVDYFNVRVSGAIVSTPLQFILNQCYQGGDDSFCNFITRRAAAAGPNNAGSLDQINSGVTNSGGLKTRGIDAVFAYRQDLGRFGRAETRVSYTHLIDGYVVPLPGEIDYFAGEIGASRDRFDATVGYSIGDVGLTLNGTYVGVAYLDDQITGFKPGDHPADEPRNIYRVSPEFYLDAQLRFQVNDHYEVYVGANNLLDNKPPFLADIGGDTGAYTLTGTYDPLGRRFYAGARLRF